MTAAQSVQAATPFTTTIAVRWADLDAQGHVNNAVIADYLQEARVDFFAATCGSDLLASGVVVVSHQVSYTAPVDAADPVQAMVWLADVRASRFQVAYQLFQRGVEVASARTTLCPFDFNTERPARLSTSDRAGLQAHLRPTEAWPALPNATLAGRGQRSELRVRWSDEDRYRHVNNVRFFDYVQQARIETTTRIDPGMARGDSPWMWLVARQDMDYLAQLSYRVEPIWVETAPVRLGRSSVSLVAEIVDPADPTAPRVCGRARTVLVCADAQGRPASLPDPVRHSLSSWMVTDN